MQQTQRFTLVMMGLLILAGLAFLIAVRIGRWPKLQHGFVRLGDALTTFAIGVLGFWLVVLVLRALGWLPSPN
jgi:hypothetical protein